MLKRFQSTLKNCYIGLALLISSCNSQTPQPTQTTAPEKDFLTDKVQYISYSPTHFNPIKGIYPSIEDVTKDLSMLRSSGFDGLITYGNDSIQMQYPRIAKSLGFKYVISGLWNITNNDDFDRAMMQKDYVDAYCLGNEGLLNHTYNIDTLESRIKMLKALTKKPVSTSEPIDEYDDRLVSLGDFVFPNVHAYWHNLREPDTSAKYTINEYNKLLARTDKAIIFKEVGLPTAGELGLREENQDKFYTLLRRSEIKFSYFEAFDQPWKNWAPVEPYWGCYDKDRNPKLVIKNIRNK